jgi:hypothetical protein
VICKKNIFFPSTEIAGNFQSWEIPNLGKFPQWEYYPFLYFRLLRWVEGRPSWHIFTLRQYCENTGHGKGKIKKS